LLPDDFSTVAFSCLEMYLFFGIYAKDPKINLKSGSYNYEKESVSKRDQQNGIITFSSQKYFHSEGQVTESPRVLAQNLFNTYIKVKQDVGGRYQVYA